MSFIECRSRDVNQGNNSLVAFVSVGCLFDLANELADTFVTRNPTGVSCSGGSSTSGSLLIDVGGVKDMASSAAVGAEVVEE